MAGNNHNSDVDEILRKYGSKIEGKIRTGSDSLMSGNKSESYLKFREEMSPELSRYERWGRSLGGLIKLNVSQKDKEKVERNLEIAHIGLEPWQALNLGVMSFMGVFLFGVFVSVAIALIKAPANDLLGGFISNFPILFFVLMIILAIFLFYFVNDYPSRLASQWRLKASSQMVPAILYVVVYMRHTPNLEKAIAFAAQHLQYPLALDFRKVFYNVEIGKFSTIKESLDNYLETWRDYSPEFIESFHLIESSLFEPDNGRRVTILEKSLHVILDGVYDKMLKFTHNVRSPLTNVYMLGVVLPTLGLALLPLASAMLGGLLNWSVVFVLFNLVVPFFVFFLTDKVMALRPGGYGESELLERNPLYYQYTDKKPYFFAFLVCFPFLLIGFLPLIFGYTPIPEWLGLQKDYSLAQLTGINSLGKEMLFGFFVDANGVRGPFGFGAVILSMLIPLSFAIFFSMVYKIRTKNLIVEREKTKELESEFNSSLFQLGNRIGNGIPPELVFGDVAQSTKGLKTEDFFKKVNYNIHQLGMSVEKAIFDPNRGAIIYYPSNLISTSMRILVESSKKGLEVAAISLMSISEYVKNIQKITQRLKDMLAEIISDMKSNMTFLAPLLSGVVVGLATMITFILNKISESTAEGAQSGIGGLGSLMNIFQPENMIPPYFLQIIVGVYLIQIIFILTNTLVEVDSGEDKLERTNKIGKNLKAGMTLYFITALIATVALFVLSVVVLSGFGG
ncbi:hypothetical protein J4474_00165 [Candidatus Pacearchaeota archaeon]|nr:hypothetical protein [Candidatus Pacearchaeota archaeon]